jgi:hypothetical protein
LSSDPCPMLLYLLFLWSTIPLSCHAVRMPMAKNSAAFSFPNNNNNYNDHDMKASTIAGQPHYQIASIDLSGRWIDLVQQGKVSATVQVPVPTETDRAISVRYGVRLVEKKTTQKFICEEFVEEADPSVGIQSELVRSINETLKSFQGEDENASGPPVKFVLDGDFATQLQLVRTLRPVPSPGFAGATSSIPPAYDATSDSFVTGPLRLELRPKVASLFVNGMTTPWDVFHNVSPADTRGHFLFLPTLADQAKNWRGQIFTKDDCKDMVFLASSIEPAGSLFLGYNSVGGAASQNHIHCHAWPCPPIPLQDRPPAIGSHEETPEEDDTDKTSGWDCYAVSRSDSLYDFYDIQDGKVEVSYLKYPVFCVQLSAADQELPLLGKALAATLKAIGSMPHNVGFLNRLQQIDDDTPQKFTDVYVFARSKERSSVLPSLKLGISEMMGVFHAQSDEELNILSTRSDMDDQGPMYQALEDVTCEDELALWDAIKDHLENME